MGKKQFYFDIVKGIVYDEDIVKFNLVNLPTSNVNEGDEITIITSLKRFQSMINFLKIESEKINEFLNKQPIEKNKDKGIKKNEKKPTKGKNISNI